MNPLRSPVAVRTPITDQTLQTGVPQRPAAAPRTAEGSSKNAGSKPEAPGKGLVSAVSRDGDTLELNYSRSMETAARWVAQGPQASEGQPDAQQIREWAEQVKKELEEQQVQLLASLTKSGLGMEKTAGAAGMTWIEAVSSAKAGGTAGGGKEAQDGDLTGVPEYWNAENTSNRIVAFATSFASIFAGESKEFSEKIVHAVADGFDQAGAITGELPGAAGRLNRDTRDLVFQKLGKWLEDWQAEPYNQDAKSLNNDAR